MQNADADATRAAVATLAEEAARDGGDADKDATSTSTAKRQRTEPPSPTLWDRDVMAMRHLKGVFEGGVGAKPNNFVNNDVRSKYMRTAKHEVLKIRNAPSGGVGGDLMFNAQDLEKLPKMTIKMMAFIYSQGIVNMFNDDASPHPDRVRVFNGIKAIIYRVADVEMFHYGDFTKEKYVAMGEYLARRH